MRRKVCRDITILITPESSSPHREYDSANQEIAVASLRPYATFT